MSRDLAKKYYDYRAQVLDVCTISKEKYPGAMVANYTDGDRSWHHTHQEKLYILVQLISNSTSYFFFVAGRYRQSSDIVTRRKKLILDNESIYTYRL